MAVIGRYYAALAEADWASVGACYADDARFADPAFPDLDAAEVRAMWKMLLTAGRDMRITFRILEESETHGAADWEASYTFSRTGRRVHNVIHSDFELRDGLIVRQRDSFDFWRWSRQALGPLGLLLGWTLFLRRRVQGIGRAALARAMGV